MKQNKKLLNKIIVPILVLVSVACLAYPKIAEAWNSSRVSKVVQQYSKQVEELDEETINEEFSKAEQFNQDISNGIENTEYDSILNTDDSEMGLMGYLSIPSIDLELPIYHSTDEEAITKGVGHMKNTSLPIGGTGTHAVLSSHCGMPNHVGFTNLSKVKEGDKFTISILNKVLTYEVDQIKIVDPNDDTDIQIDSEKDYVTLLTCYPYGINSHRLLVRGHRVENTTTEEMVVNRTWLDWINDLSFQSKAICITAIAIAIILAVSKIKSKKMN